jgi:choline kinase
MVILLPAAGFGVRMPHKAGSKELIEVKGIPIIERSLVASCLCDGPNIVVIRPGKEDIRQFIENSTYSKRVSFVDQYDFTAYGTSPGLHRLSTQLILLYQVRKFCLVFLIQLSGR